MPNFTGNVSAAPLDSEYARFGVLWAPGSTQLTYYFDGKAVAHLERIQHDQQLADDGADR